MFTLNPKNDIRYSWEVIKNSDLVDNVTLPEAGNHATWGKMYFVYRDVTFELLAHSFDEFIVSSQEAVEIGQRCESFTFRVGKDISLHAFGNGFTIKQKETLTNDLLDIIEEFKLSHSDLIIFNTNVNAHNDKNTILRKISEKEQELKNLYEELNNVNI